MEIKMKNDVITFLTRIYNAGLTTASGGNISLRNKNEVILTPTGKDKGNLKIEDLAIVDLESGELLSECKPSCEKDMHLETYKNREDSMAIIHAHPPFTSIFSVLDTKIDLSLLSEAYIFLRKIVYVPYAMPSSKELANYVATAAKDCDVIVLRNHGVVVLGKDLMDCFHKIEVLEALCHLQYHTLGRKDICRLKSSDLAEIDKNF